MRNLRRLAVLSTCLLGLLGYSCGTSVNGIAVLVDLANVPAGSAQTTVTFTLNGKANTDPNPFLVPAGAERFAFGLPSGSAGTVVVNVQAIGTDNCLVGSGSATVQVNAGTDSYETTVNLAPASGCLLQVAIQGDGSVSVAGRTCSTSCSLTFARGQTVSPLATLGFSSNGGSWGGACSGAIATPCMVTLNQGQQVSVNFISRDCSPDGICAFPLPSGAQVSTVWGSQGLGSGTYVAAGVGLFSNTGPQYPAWSALASNLPTSPIASVFGGDVGSLYVLFQNGQLYRSTGGTPSPLNFSMGPSNFNGTLIGGTFADSNASYVFTSTNNIYLLNPGSFMSQTVNAPQPINAIAVGMAAFAVGHGLIWQQQGSTWSPVPCPTTKNLYGVWADASSTHAFAVGEGGIILQFSQGTWSIVDPGDGRTLRSIWGPSPNSVWAVGDRGAVRHFTETAGWATPAMPASGASANLTAVTGGTGLWFTGPGSVMYGAANPNQ